VTGEKKIKSRKRRPSIKKELRKLQNQFALSDLFDGPSMPGVMRLIVIVLKDIKIRMDGNKNHKRPHVHVEYGKDYHAASYSIDTGERLAGNLASRYDRLVADWIASCRPKLLELWKFTQESKNTNALISELRAA
jgi:hypothetical protein